MNTTNNNNYNDSEIEIDLKKVYLSLIKGIKWIIIIPSITVIIAVIYVLFIAKPIYTSETTLLLINSGGNQSRLSGLAGQFGFSLPLQDDNVNYLSAETLPEILSSRTLAKSLLHTDFNSREFNEPTSLLNIITNQKNIDSADSNKIIVNAIKQVSENILEIKRIKNKPMFTLLVNSPEPQLSAEISAVIITELEKLQSDFTKHELLNKKEFILERLDDVQNELNQAETKLKTFREQNLQISLSPTLLLHQERLQREIEIQTQIYISLKQQFEQVKIEEAQNKSWLKIIDPPNIPIYHSKPKRKIIVILTGLIGLTIGGIIAVVKNYGGIEQ
ncbi:MAG: hypothetical protein GWP19_04675 [Planctomycetia bacterium]|nr:hypothetical protein [Planctomycetia bacterium]